MPAAAREDICFNIGRVDPHRDEVGDGEEDHPEAEGLHEVEVEHDSGTELRELERVAVQGELRAVLNDLIQKRFQIRAREP